MELSARERAILSEFVRRENALNSLGAFREYMASSGHADFQYPHAAHHALMARALERLERGEITRLMVLLPPGSAKSTIVSVQFACWFMARHPRTEMLCVSATQALAESFARRRRTALKAREWRALSGTELDPSQTSIANFGVLAGGQMTAAGTGTSIIGRRSQLTIVDDPVSSFEAVNSDTQRAAAWEWFGSELRSRLTPGGKEIIVSTRWHARDIPGEILRGEEAKTWEVIRIPMLADSEDDPLGREHGEMLWPDWFTDEMVREAQRHPLRWSCMYQQLPLVDEGDWLSPSELPIVDKAPEGLGIYGAVDLAMTQGRGDFSVIVIAGIDKARRLTILDVWRDRVTADMIVEHMLRLHRKWGCREFLLDDDPAAKVYRATAHELFRRRGTGVYIRAMPTRGRDKATRAAAFQAFAKQGGVSLLRGNWNADLLREVNEFPAGDHDDQVDCLGLLGRRLAHMGSTVAEQPKPKTQPPKMITRQGRLHLNDTLRSLFEQRDRQINNRRMDRI